jgi:hypothetical protein
MSGYVRLCQVISGKSGLFQDIVGYVRLFRVTSGYFRSGHFSL